MSRKLFITGTDTNVGKTYISVGLLKAFAKLGFATIGIKPLASGAHFENAKLIHDDGKQLNLASTIRLNHYETNPYQFTQSIAPHIAAAENNVNLTLQSLIDKTKYIFKFPSDIHIIEGVGGWSVPLNQQESMRDFVKHHKMAVILVVGIKLGCINHAVLTFEAIRRDNLKVIGWVANCLFPEELVISEIISSINNLLPVPLLGKVNFQQAPEQVLRLDLIIC